MVVRNLEQPSRLDFELDNQLLGTIGHALGEYDKLVLTVVIQVAVLLCWLFC